MEVKLRGGKKRKTGEEEGAGKRIIWIVLKRGRREKHAKDTLSILPWSGTFLAGGIGAWADEVRKSVI